MDDTPTDSPAIWTLTCCTVDGGSFSRSYGTFDEALAAVPQYLERPECDLVALGCSADWRRDTLFMFTSEVQNDQPFQKPGTVS